MRVWPQLLALGGSVLILAWVAAWAVGGGGLLDAVAAYLQAYNKLTLADPSALSRLWAWQKDLEILATHPVTGVGFNMLGFVQQDFGIYFLEAAAFGLDGGLLFVAALTGLIGVAVYGAILVLAVGRGFRLARHPDASAAERDLGAAAVGITILWAFHGFFVNSLFYPHLMVVVWIVWGAVGLASRRLASSGTP
jgi:hypothetical protein